MAAIKDSFEYRKAILLSAKLVETKNYTNIEEILQAVASGEAKIGLVDASNALGYEKKMESLNLKIYKVLSYNTGFGIVLTGEGSRLYADIQSFVTSNQNYITSFVEREVGLLQPTVIEVEEVMFTEEEASTTLLNLTIALVVMMLVGILIWIVFIRKRFRIQPSGLLILFFFLYLFLVCLFVIKS